MKFGRVVLNPALIACATVLLSGCASESGESDTMQEGMAIGNQITGEGLPNPAPTVTANWGDLPADREWGSTAGIDIDPIDGHVWAYERCGSGSAGGPGINCQSNPVDPIFKFDRNSGEVLANFGSGIFVTPHGIHVDDDGNYLDSRYMYGRISGIFVTDEDMMYAIDSESGLTNHPAWVNGVRIGHVDRDYIEAFVPGHPADTRPYQGAAGEGVAVDGDGNVYAAEGPNSLQFAGGAFTKYSVSGM